MRFASLGSGSEGNALLVEAASGTTRTRVLIDCGFSVREAERRLTRLNLNLASLDAILVTHEHADHMSGALALARKAHIPLLMSWGTAQAVGVALSDLNFWVLRDGETAQIGDLEVFPYTVPHDAREPVQFVLSDGQHRLGVLTDAGEITPHMIRTLHGCAALVLECNHDRNLLAQSAYPPVLKARIGGSHGHLANDAAAGLLRALDCSQLKHLIAAHLSAANNRPELAQTALAEALGAQPAEIRVATQEEGFSWLAV